MVAAAVVVELQVRPIDSHTLAVPELHLLLVHPNVPGAQLVLHVLDVPLELRILPGAWADGTVRVAQLWHLGLDGDVLTQAWAGGHLRRWVLAREGLDQF